MNEFGTECVKSIIGKLENQEAMLKEIRSEMERLKENHHNGFTDFDRATLEFTMKKTDEALESLHLSVLNLKTVAG